MKWSLKFGIKFPNCPLKLYPETHSVLSGFMKKELSALATIDFKLGDSPVGGIVGGSDGDGFGSGLIVAGLHETTIALITISHSAI